MAIARRLFLSLFALTLAIASGCKSGDLSTPKGAAKNFATAMENGDADGAKRASTGADPAMIDSMVKLAGNMKKLRDAAVSKFGDQGKDLLGSAGGADSMDMAKKVDDADVKEDGDNATLTPKSGGQPIKLKKISGEWKVDASELTEMVSKMGGGMFDSMSQAATDTASDINAGKFKTAQEAQQAFGSKMMSAAMTSHAPAGPAR